MTKKLNKRGFTIVELVVVIVVIAILAAVLIPTVSSLVSKANLSADEQAVRQMNTALAIYTVENGAPETIYQVKTALYENDINADSLVPVTQGYAFYWDNTNNKIVLVGKDKATAQKGWVLLTSTGYGIEKSLTNENPVGSLKDAIKQSSTTEPVLVKLDKDFSVSADTTTEEVVKVVKDKSETKKGVFCVGAGQSLIIDANGKTITSAVADGNLFLVHDGGQLVVKNAEINTKFGAFVNLDGTLRVENVTVTLADANSQVGCVYVDGLSDTYIVNSTFNQNVLGHGIATNSSYDESDGSRLTLVNTDVFVGKGCLGAAINITTYTNVVIDGGTFSGGLTGGTFRGCNATIKNAIFTHDSDEKDRTKWSGGNVGVAADIVFACGGTKEFTGYIATANYVCENVTAKTVAVHEPEGGSVTVSGIDNYSKYTETQITANN